MLVVAELCKLSSLLQLHKIKVKKMAVELPVPSFHYKKSRARGHKLRKGAVAGQDDWFSFCYKILQEMPDCPSNPILGCLV